MSIKLLLREELKKKLGGLATSSVYAYMRWEFDPLPRPIRLSANRVAWIEAEVDAWLERRMDARAQVAGIAHDSPAQSDYQQRVFTRATDVPRLTVPAGNGAFEQRGAL